MQTLAFPISQSTEHIEVNQPLYRINFKDSKEKYEALFINFKLHVEGRGFSFTLLHLLHLNTINYYKPSLTELA